MFRKFGIVCAALALFSIAGGHWAVMQSVAWAEMLRDYTQRAGSLAVAVEQTFDGQHPCQLCREIAAAKSKVKESPNIPGVKKDAEIKALMADSIPALADCAETRICFARLRVISGPDCADSPPTPPPRCGENAA